MSGMVRPSSKSRARTGRRMVAAPEPTGKAIDIFERFTGHDAKYLDEVEVKPLPKVAAKIGHITAICYSTRRDGKLEQYMHEFARVDQPIFAVSPDGTQLLMIGGNYDFTERGIVDKSDKSR